MAVVVATLFVQLVVLIVQSQHQWQHFNLSVDFAFFHQAWHQIGSGDLNPRSTLAGYSFWQSHFELIAWPLGLLGRLRRDDGLSMLYLQDLAVVGTEAVVLAWVWSATRQRRGGWPVTFTVPVALVLLVANPWIYKLANEDFHYEPLATFFVVLAAWEFWSGRRRAWVWVALTLACGDVAATYIAGIGLSFLIASRRTRRDGLHLLGVGLGWVLLVGLLGANLGSGLVRYSYLASSPKPVEGLGGLISVGMGMLHHPSRPLHAISGKLGRVSDHLAPAGVFGVVAPWSFGIVVVVLLENTLNGEPLFIRLGFQNGPVYAFSVLGTLLLLLSLSRRRDWWRFVAIGALVLVMINAIVYDRDHLHRLNLFHVSARAADELAAVRQKVPADAEVVSTSGVIGRFAGRKSVHAMLWANARLPVDAQAVVFVFAPTAGNQPLAPSALERTMAYVHDQLGAHILYEGAEVTAYEWRPVGQKSVTLP